MHFVDDHMQNEFLALCLWTFRPTCSPDALTSDPLATSVSHDANESVVFFFLNPLLCASGQIDYPT
jgi:hypothetical protein